MYTTFYGLHGEPFLLTPDPRFYFESSVHSQAMAHLTYGLSRAEGFIVITGEIGAGKTTLVKHLLATLDNRRILSAHVVTTQLDSCDLLRSIAWAFGLTDVPSEKSSILNRLERFFESAHKSDFRCLLIVDEAQNLPVSSLEELRMLSNFQIGNVAPFQSFLVGQPQFRAVLANPALEQFQQRVIATYHLGPMNRQECSEYLFHRLQQVGWSKDPSFDSVAADAIFNHTGGIPRRINALCTRLLLFGFLDDIHHFTAHEVNKVAADLDAENSNLKANGAANGVAVDVSNGSASQMIELTSADSEMLRRVEGLERRLSQQEAFMKRVASAVQDFLRFGQSDSS